MGADKKENKCFPSLSAPIRVIRGYSLPDELSKAKRVEAELAERGMPQAPMASPPDGGSPEDPVAF